MAGFKRGMNSPSSNTIEPKEPRENEIDERGGDQTPAS